MCWQSRKAIPRCRYDWNAFAFFVCLGEGHLEEDKVKGNAEYTIYTYKHIHTWICTF